MHGATIKISSSSWFYYKETSRLYIDFLTGLILSDSETKSAVSFFYDAQIILRF